MNGFLLEELQSCQHDYLSVAITHCADRQEGKQWEGWIVKRTKLSPLQEGQMLKGRIMNYPQRLIEQKPKNEPTMI